MGHEGRVGEWRLGEGGWGRSGRGKKRGVLEEGWTGG